MIGGNTYLKLKVNNGKYAINDIGERVPEMEDLIELHGFLDMSTSDAHRNTYNAKIEESDYIFICDYVSLPQEVLTFQVTAENNGKVYDVLLIDNVMNLNKHYEIYLRYKGA